MADGTTPPSAEDPTAGQKERSFEVGMDESWKANLKRTYDETSGTGLTETKRNELLFNASYGQMLTQLAQINALALQHAQNAVSAAHEENKTSRNSQNIAADAEWNPVQQGAGDTLTARAVSIDDASLKAIGAMVAAAVANAIAATKA